MFSGQHSIAKFIDHTLLRADADRKSIERLCREAVEEGFFSVCVNPFWVKTAADLLKGKDVKVCTVIGFPLGADTPEMKVYQGSAALDQGARELDMVVNIGAVKSGEYNVVEREIKEVKKAAGANIVKVIIETCFLNESEKIEVCRLAKECGADFVKTSTGFGTAGASVEDVRLMRETVGPGVGVKASGGIRDLDTLVRMVEAGANRIGSSSGIRITEQFRNQIREEEL